METVLGGLRAESIPATPALFDALFAALDGLQQEMAAHLEGQPTPAETHEQLLARLKELTDPGAPTTPRPPVHSRVLPVAPAPSPTSVPEIQTVQPSMQQPDRDSPGRLSSAPATPVIINTNEDSIRVATVKLDRLMDGVGELLVTHMQQAEHVDQIGQLSRQVEEWDRQWQRMQTRWLQADSAALFLDTMTQDFLINSGELLQEISDRMEQLATQTSADQNRADQLVKSLQDEVHQVRMLPIATLFDQFHRVVRDLARSLDKEVVLHISGAETELDRHVLELVRDPLIHLLRNSVDHGIEAPTQRQAAGKNQTGNIWLQAVQQGNTVHIAVRDDGQGVDLPALRTVLINAGLLDPASGDQGRENDLLDAIFRPGISTAPQVTQLSGRGVGLDVVRRNLEQLQGTVSVQTEAGKGTSFSLTLPLTIATSQVLLCQAAGLTVALPVNSVQRILRMDPDQIRLVDRHPAVTVDGEPLTLFNLTHLLELNGGATSELRGKILVVLLSLGGRRLAMTVEGVSGIQEVVIKSLGPQLRRVRNVAGMTILGDGQLVSILNLSDLERSAQHRKPLLMQTAPVPILHQRRRILLADDSITTRTLERNILQNAGYEVLVAVDGQQAWSLLQTERVDAIVSDINMPRMDGFELARKVRADTRLERLPLVLVSSLAAAQDRVQGMEAGADAYIAKGDFDQTELLAVIERLL